jgi:hypothetical protein
LGNLKLFRVHSWVLERLWEFFIVNLPMRFWVYPTQITNPVEYALHYFSFKTNLKFGLDTIKKYFLSFVLNSPLSLKGFILLLLNQRCSNISRSIRDKPKGCLSILSNSHACDKLFNNCFIEIYLSKWCSSYHHHCQ